MSISFQCTGCGRTLKVADELAGRKAKCPQCQTVLYIPEGPAVAMTPAPTPAHRRAAAAPPPQEFDDGADAGADVGEEEPRPRRKKKAKKSSLLPLLLVGGGVLLLLLAGGGFAAWWFLSGGGGGEDLVFMPDGAQMVGTVHVTQLLNSGAFQQTKSQIPAVSTSMDGMTSELGTIKIDDIDQIYFGSQSLANSASAAGVIMVVHTTRAIKPAEFETSMGAKGVPITFSETKVGNYTVYDGKSSSAAPGLNSPAITSFAYADDKRIVLGPTALLHKVLERNKKPDLSDKLQAAIKETDFNATIAFAADAKGAFPKASPQAAAPPNPFAPPTVSFDKVDGLSVTVKVGNDVDVTATAMCQDAASAGELRDGVKKEVDWARGMLAALALAGKAPPADVSSQLSIEPQVNGSTVTVKKTISVAPILKWAKDQMNVPTKGPRQ